MDGMSRTLLTAVDASLQAAANSTNSYEISAHEVESGDYDPSTLAVLVLMMLVGVALMVGHWLELNKVDWMSEAGGSLMLGILIGLVLKLAPFPSSFEGVFHFSAEFFFLALLPPIMFDAGFNLNVHAFFHNVGAIMMMAFLGTVVSTAVIALTVYVAGLAGLSYHLTFFEASIFGTIVSVTDTVTILAVFGRLNADVNLNALVFGESCMNDAVAIVLYRVIGGFASKPVTTGAVLMGVVEFCKIFVGSLAAGVLFGMGAAMAVKTDFFRNAYNPVEATLIIIIAYCSFYITDGFGFSGIVSMMVCGIVMAKYVRPNLSDEANDRVAAFFRTVSSLAEIFAFIYAGSSLFTMNLALGKGLTWAFIFFSVLGLALSRLGNVYPNAACVNWFRPPEMQIPETHKFMLWFAGLRGSMAFALAMLAREAGILGPIGDVFVGSTFFMVLFTVLINGGAMPYLIVFLNLREPDPSAPHPNPLMPSEDSLLAGGPDDASEMTSLMGGMQNSSSRPISHAGSKSKMGVRDHIYDFQRTGGIQERFKQFDKHIGKVLLSPNAGKATKSTHGSYGSHAGDVQLASNPHGPNSPGSASMRRSTGETPH